MDAAITAAVGLGAALLGVVGGFWGADRLERRREARRRVGIITALCTDLSENSLRGSLLVEELKKEPGAAGPLWAYVGPVSADFWRAHMRDAGSFLPYDLLFRMRIAYSELEQVKRFGDDPAAARSPASAIAFVEASVCLLDRLQGELLALPEGKALASKTPAVMDFVRDRKEELRRRIPD